MISAIVISVASLVCLSAQVKRLLRGCIADVCFIKIKYRYYTNFRDKALIRYDPHQFPK